MDHTQLRAEFRALGVQNSFDGSTVEFMRSLLMRMYAGESAPAQLLCVDTIRQQRRAEYTRLLRSVSLEQLMTCLPEPLWQHYMSTKWLKTGLALTSKEKRMLALCHRVSFAELGVNPTDRTTWQHARHVTNYDWSYGWQRWLCHSQAQLYLATHPAVYRLYVGLYARLLLRQRARHGSWPPGVNDEEHAKRCCVELRLQLYNNKLALPSSTEHSFSHLDCDWVRGGCTETPAPQCVVATSPQHVDNQRVYTVRFVDVEDEVIRHEQQVSNGDAPAATWKRPAPYHLPRERHGASVGMARREPAGTDFSGAHSSGPELDVGDVLFFDHLAAHSRRSWRLGFTACRTRVWTRSLRGS